MGYRDDFYVVANIIGITGPVNELPSVYFRCGAEYGHITQIHKRNYNCGRTRVKTDATWQITNVCPDTCKCGKQASHEINGEGRVFHISRSLYKPASELTPDERNVVAESIYRCPFMKTDPREGNARLQAEADYQQRWDEAHVRGRTVRRGAIDYTGEGLAKNVFAIFHPDRVK